MGRTSKEIAWIAGLLEGEGCFSFDRRAVIQLAMTDKDVVKKASKLFGASLTGPYLRKSSWSYAAEYGKNSYWTGCFASKAIGWMMMIYQFMGKRRQQKIKSIIKQWRKQPAHPRAVGKTSIYRERWA